jgi:hypothetical protein
MNERIVVDQEGRSWACSFVLQPEGDRVGVCKRVNTLEARAEVLLPNRRDWLTMPDHELAEHILVVLGPDAGPRGDREE